MARNKSWAVTFNTTAGISPSPTILDTEEMDFSREQVKDWAAREISSNPTYVSVHTITPVSNKRGKGLGNGVDFVESRDKKKAKT